MPNQPGSTITKSDYAEYLQSDHWRETRKQRIEDGTGACERCEIPRWLAEIAYDQDLHVHHKHYRSKGREEHDDLEVLCRRCHEIETFGRSDQRQVKSHICDRCGKNVWNPRASQCQICLFLEGLEPEENVEDDEGILAIRFNSEVVHDRSLVWQSLLWRIHFHLRENTTLDEATGHILNELSDIESLVKRAMARRMAALEKDETGFDGA